MTSDELEKSCEENLERLYDIAFLRRRVYMHDGTPYYQTIAENPEFRLIYESYRDLFEYVKNLRKEMNLANNG